MWERERPCLNTVILTTAGRNLPNLDLADPSLRSGRQGVGLLGHGNWPSLGLLGHGREGSDLGRPGE